jgi:hypothetical protein
VTQGAVLRWKGYASVCNTSVPKNRMCADLPRNLAREPGWGSLSLPQPITTHRPLGQHEQKWYVAFEYSR